MEKSKKSILHLLEMPEQLTQTDRRTQEIITHLLFIHFKFHLQFYWPKVVGNKGQDLQPKNTKRVFIFLAIARRHKIQKELEQ